MDWLAKAHKALPIEAATLRAWTRLINRHSDSLSKDNMVAATAQVHGLTLVCRSVAKFQALAVSVFNPFTSCQDAVQHRITLPRCTSQSHRHACRP